MLFRSEDAGLLEREWDGRIRRCQLDPKPMRSAAEWLETYRRFWEAQLDELERYLRETSSPSAEQE